MPRFARIQDGIISEIITVDSIDGRYDPSMVWADVTNVAGAAVGKSYDSATATVSDPDASAPAHIGLTKLQFRHA